MNLKLKEEVFHSPLPTMPCWHIDEGNCQPAGVNIQILSYKRDKIILWVSIVIWHNLCKSYNWHYHSPRKSWSWNKICKNRSIMTTSTKVWIPSIVNAMPICHHDDWRDGAKRTWICLCETRNPTSLAMGQKNPELHHVWQCSLPWHNKVNVSM
jgi:hypothetical protein